MNASFSDLCATTGVILIRFIPAQAGTLRRRAEEQIGPYNNQQIEQGSSQTIRHHAPVLGEIPG